jgi:transcriptional regulator with XRE-family HTH domain
MAKHLNYQIGSALKAAREAAWFSKARLATAAKCTRSAVARVERGEGSLRSLNRLAGVLGLELRGRRLPNGPIGLGLKTLRQQRHLSVAKVASMLKSSSPTIKRLERGGTTRLDIVQAYGALFGIDFYLAPKGARNVIRLE